MKIVKRVLMALLALVIVLALGLYATWNWYFWLPMRWVATPMDGQDVIRTETGVRVEFSSMDGVSYAVFNEARELVDYAGLTPIAFDRANLAGLWTYDSFVAEYGAPHAELGSTGIWTVWVTDDGYLLKFWNGGGDSFGWLDIGDYSEVEMFDLLAGGAADLP